jgi:Anti-sigma-K factor rskA, C-terminal
VIAGKRVQPAGLFPGGAGRTYLRLTTSVPAVATVAVTREKAGGVAAPTGAILISAKVKPT